MPIVPGKVPEKIIKHIESGSFQRVMNADLHTKEGQQTICDELTRSGLVRKDKTIVPFEASDPIMMIVGFLEDINDKVIVHASSNDGNHRFNALDDSVFQRQSNPNAKGGLNKPGDPDFLSNESLPGWELQNNAIDKDSAMKESYRRMFDGKPSAMTTKLTVDIYTVRKQSDSNLIMKKMVEKSEDQGLKNAGTSEPSLKRQLQKPLRAIDPGNRKHVIETDVAKAHDNVEIQVTMDSGKKKSVNVDDMTGPFFAKILTLNGVSYDEISDQNVTVHECNEENDPVGRGTMYPPQMNAQNLWLGLTDDASMKRIYMVVATKSPLIMKAVCKFLRVEYSPELARVYIDLMKKHPLELDALGTKDLAALKDAYATGDSFGFTTSPTPISMSLIITNYLVNLMIADEVSPDDERSYFKETIANLTKLTTTGYSDRDLINLLCKFITYISNVIFNSV